MKYLRSIDGMNYNLHIQTNKKCKHPPKYNKMCIQERYKDKVLQNMVEVLKHLNKINIFH
jgi:phage-related protein